MSGGQQPENPQNECWNKLYAEVNAWRGECMHHIAAAEKAVTETLLALDAVKPDGAKVQLRHLIGQRLDDLAVAIGAEGPFAEAGKAAAKSLEKWREHEAFRASLCHGVVQVTMTRGGGWLLAIRNLTIRARQAETKIVVIEKAEAEAKLKQLARDGQKLASVLGQLRQKVKKG